MNKSKLLLLNVVMICAGNFSAAVPAYADVSLNAHAGTYYSDNLGRLSTQERGELVLEIGAGIAADYQSGNSSWELNSSVKYLDYGNSPYDDETLFDLIASGVLEIIPNRVSWEVTENLGQRTVDPFIAERPGNRDPISVFVTGPTVRLLNSGRNVLDLRGRYKSVNVEKSIVDYVTLLGGLTWRRALPGSRSFGVGVDTERFEFDSVAAGSDYDVQRAFVQFESETSASSLDLMLGGNALHDGNQEETGLFTRVNYLRALGNGADFRIEVERGFADSGQTFASRQDQQLLPREADDVFSTSDPYVASSIVMTGSKETPSGAKTTVRFRWEDNEYETQKQLNREIFGIELLHERAISAKLKANISADIGNRKFRLQSDDSYSIQLGLAYQVAESVGVEVFAGHFDRDSSPSFTSFTESRLGVRVNVER